LSSTPAAAQPLFSAETVDAAGNVGQYTSLALDAAGNPHISYQDASRGRARYARRAGSTWVAEDIGAGGVTSNRALDLDSNDVPRVAVSAAYGAAIATRSNAVWSLETIGGYAIWWAALDIGGDDAPHIAYMWSIGSGTYQGFVAYDRGDIAPNLFVPQNPSCSLAIDASNDPHLVVTLNEPDPMRYWVHRGGSWREETLPVGSWPAIALDGSGVPHVAFYDPAARDLVCGSRAGGVWAFEMADATGDVGKYPSLVVDAAGGLHVTYYDATHADLKYAVKASPAGAWSVTTVDAAGDVGEWSSLRVIGGESVHVSYYDRTNGDLKYAAAYTAVPVKARTLGGVKALYRDAQRERP
jgi:hypothetical protein